MTEAQLEQLLRHPAVKRAHLVALAVAAGVWEDGRYVPEEELRGALLKAGGERIEPWLGLLPEGVVREEDEVEESGSDDPASKLEALKLALDNSSKINRNLGLAFVGFMFYILVMIASTTDLMLFMPDSRINLPIVNVELPLIGFYAVTPFIVLVFHFYVLINLYNHRKKYDRWKAAAGENPDTEALHPFLFNYLDGYRTGSLLRFLYRSLVLASVFFFPFVNVVLLQFRFADYHDFSISMVQLGASLASGMLVWFFSPRLLNSLFHKSQRVYKRGLLHLFWMKAAMLLGMVIAGLIGSVSVILELNKNNEEPLHETITESWWFPRIDLSYFVDEVNAMEEDLVFKYMKDSTSLSEARLLASRNHRKELNLEGRNLSYAYLSDLDLSNANLKYSNLNHARLAKTIMQDAKLYAASLKKSDLVFAQLQGAFLQDAQLQGASLYGAQLQDADLQNAQLQGADLSFAQLQGAGLLLAQLQGADLLFAQLQGADLQYAQLQGADLQNAQLQDAELREAQLQGADLRGAQLQGADLHNAQLQGADLQYAQLQGAKLQYAHLQGADLHKAQLQGADLQNAQLQGADLRDAFVTGIQFDSVYQFFHTVNEGINQDTLINWNRILSDTIKITNRFNYKREFFARINRAQENVKAHKHIHFPPGISSHQRADSIYVIACQGRFECLGILSQYRDAGNFHHVYQSIQQHCPVTLQRIPSNLLERRRISQSVRELETKK